MRKVHTCGLAIAVASLLVLISAASVSAHEVRTVGNYVFTVGWLHEPTYVGVENAVQVFVHDTHGNAVADLNSGDLKVTVASGGQTSGSMDLTPTYDPDTGLGIQGEYDAAVLPTSPGTYTFHITGSVHGQSIDQSFSSSSSTFDDVKDPSPIEFPSKQPTATELGTLTTKLQARVATLESSLATTQSNLNNAQNVATRAEIIAIAGVVIGLAGIAVAVIALRRKPTVTREAS